MTLKLEGITVTFRDGARSRNVLQDLSWQCERGQVSVLMGSSGSGKSTLLRVISTDLEPNAGHVLYDGRDYTSLPRRKREVFKRDRIAQIFQNYTLLDSLTALENAALACELRGMPVAKARCKAKAAMKLLHLDEVERAFPATLSGGEQQRVAIARCLTADADIILADEPTGSLDEDMTGEVCCALRQLADSGKHVLVVTHDPQVAATGDRVARLSGGKICD